VVALQHQLPDEVERSGANPGRCVRDDKEDLQWYTVSQAWYTDRQS
jgi:hypothetical protein